MKRQRGSRSAPQTEDLPLPRVDMPDRVGRFRIERPIGQGGMSDVYEAFDPELGRHVALKVLSPMLGRNREFTDRFIRESRSAAALNHPHIVPIYEAGADGDTLFIAMLLVRGRDLKTHIEERGPLPVADLRGVITQAALALDHAHGKGLLHRDVKPANLMLEERDEGMHVYLTDFGLTKSLGTDSRITNTGELVGSVHYVSPEHLEGRELDVRSDVYSLGCVLHECLTGRPPFERDMDMAVLWAHLNADIPRPSRVRGQLPSVVDRVVARALSKDPADRFSTCSELAESLASAIDGIPHNLPVPVKRERPPLGPRLRAIAAVATTMAVLGAAVTVSLKDWSPIDYVPSANESEERRPSKAEIAGKGPGGERASARSTNRDSERAERDPRDRSEVLAASTQLGSDGAAGDETVGDPQGVRLVPTRTERGNYDFRSNDVPGLGDECEPDGTSPVGCSEFTLNASERFVDIVITDNAGRPVGAFIKQDYDSDPNWDGPWISLCDATPEPVEVRPGARIQIEIDGDGCDGRSDPTFGTIVARVFRVA